MQEADELRRYRKAKFGNAGKCATDGDGTIPFAKWSRKKGRESMQPFRSRPGRGASNQSVFKDANLSDRPPQKLQKFIPFLQFLQ